MYQTKTAVLFTKGRVFSKIKETKNAKAEYTKNNQSFIYDQHTTKNMDKCFPFNATAARV